MSNSGFSPFRAQAPVDPTNTDAYRGSWNALLLHRSQTDVDALLSFMLSTLKRNHAPLEGVKIHFDGLAYQWSDVAIKQFAEASLEPFRILEGAGKLFGTQATSSRMVRIFRCDVFCDFLLVHCVCYGMSSAWGIW
jgi:hypothetical protein